MWEKEKMLVTKIFSFSHKVFKSFLSPGFKIWDSMEKGKKDISKHSVADLFNPFPNDKCLDSSKLKEFADDNFNSVENSRKLFKQEENTVGKGEIARYEQFLLFPQCFLKTCTVDT